MICTKCNQPMTEETRAFSSPSVPLSYCKRCYHKYQLKTNLRRRRAKKDRAIGYKGFKCLHCGLQDPDHPELYDFHHIDTTKKRATIQRLITNKWETIRQELDKCVMLCANCHRKEHALLAYYRGIVTDWT